MTSKISISQVMKYVDSHDFSQTAERFDISQGKLFSLIVAATPRSRHESSISVLVL